MNKKSDSFDGVPGVKSENLQGSQKISLVFSLIVSLTLFGLLPLSEFIRSDEWLVRQVDAPPFSPPAPPKTQMERIVEVESLKPVSQPRLERSSVKLTNPPIEVSLEVGPGDFKTSFSLAGFNPIPDAFSGELVFDIHELDRNPSVIQRGSLRYPSHLKRRGLEGEVKLLIQIDEKGKVKVLEIVSSTHPDFEKPSREAAESSIYEPPKRNGEAVKVQFFLPVRFSLLK